MAENKFLDKEGLTHYHSLLLGIFPSTYATNDDIAAIFLSENPGTDDTTLNV